MQIDGLKGLLKLGYVTVAELGTWSVSPHAEEFTGAAKVTRILNEFWYEHGDGYSVALVFGRKGLGGPCLDFERAGDIVRFRFLHERGKT